MTAIANSGDWADGNQFPRSACPQCAKPRRWQQPVRRRISLHRTHQADRDIARAFSRKWPVTSRFLDSNCGTDVGYRRWRRHAVKFSNSAATGEIWLAPTGSGAEHSGRGYGRRDDHSRRRHAAVLAEARSWSTAQMGERKCLQANSAWHSCSQAYSPQPLAAFDSQADNNIPDGVTSDNEQFPAADIIFDPNVTDNVRQR